MPNSSYVAFLPLAAVGVLGLAGVKVPNGTSAFFFWTVSIGIAAAVLAVAALIFIGFTHPNEKVRESIRYGAGLPFVAIVLAWAIYMIPAQPVAL